MLFIKTIFLSLDWIYCLILFSLISMKIIPPSVNSLGTFLKFAFPLCFWLIGLVLKPHLWYSMLTPNLCSVFMPGEHRGTDGALGSIQMSSVHGKHLTRILFLQPLGFIFDKKK